MTQPRAAFLDLQSISPGDLSLQPLLECGVDWTLHDATTAAELLDHAGDARVLVSNKVRIDRAHMEALPGLRMICVAATGTNNIDLPAAREHGIVVSNARDYATASVVEHVFSLLLTLTRRLDRYRERVRDGAWSQSNQFCLFDQTIEELAGKTLGIIGYGTLGRAVEQLALAFSMRVQIAQRLHGEAMAGRTPLARLLETSDVVSLHCPLATETRNLIGAAQLRAMKPDAILINTARGGIVDEAALLNAIQNGWIGGAAIDVLSEEPPAVDNPLTGLCSPRLIVTPHVAWASRSARQRLVEEIAANTRAYLEGAPRNQVS